MAGFLKAVTAGLRDAGGKIVRTFTPGAVWRAAEDTVDDWRAALARDMPAFDRAWQWWKGVAEWMQDKVTRVILFFVFVLLIGPYAIAAKIMGKDFLKPKYTSEDTYWVPRAPDPETEEDYLRMG